MPEPIRAITVSDVKKTTRSIQHAFVRQEASRLPRHRRPGYAAICAAVHARARVSDAHVDGLRCVAGSACTFVESDPVETLIVCQVAKWIRWILYVVAWI